MHDRAAEVDDPPQARALRRGCEVLGRGALALGERGDALPVVCALHRVDQVVGDVDLVERARSPAP